MAECAGAIEPLAVLAGDVAVAEGDGRGAGEPQAVATNAATSVTTAKLQPEVGRGSRDLTYGLYAIGIARVTGRFTAGRRLPLIAVRGSHRIVCVEATEEAERRGLVLALPASIEVTVVGDTGISPTRVTSWPITVVRREEWLEAARRRSA